ncbi:MAG: alpha/beta hydrolase [Chloroflexi bacterium]|nr:alpha/beta hydrolase [Chloroflexota bacterium]MCI0649600.1 alpha/beta hydrolase [Chloroflexota bacterium]MCI0725368.1 alpha/beta hydrolase [Chloroflexota bacterium]
MATWQPYLAVKGGQGHTVVGNVKILKELYSPQLDNRRDIVVYLPPSYETRTGQAGAHYPVIYMQDGQNLFDAATSFAGEWQVDETMEALSQAEGIEAIVVGIPNTGRYRLDEYSPFRESRLGGGRGEEYLAFIVETVKPIIDADFRTCSGREDTAILGSSMGGLISLYAFFHRPDIFGLAGIMSPALWFAHSAIYDYVENTPFNLGRLYLDVGTREHGDGGPFKLPTRSRRYYASVRRLQRLLVAKGYQPRRTLLYVEEKWGRHEEMAWRRRLPKAIRFLLKSSAE